MAPVCESSEFVSTDVFATMEFVIDRQNKSVPMKKRLTRKFMADSDGPQEIVQTFRSRNFLNNRMLTESLLPFKKRLFDFDALSGEEIVSDDSKRDTNECETKRQRRSTRRSLAHDQDGNGSQRSAFVPSPYETPVTRQRTRGTNKCPKTETSPTPFDTEANVARPDKRSAANERKRDAKDAKRSAKENARKRRKSDSLAQKQPDQHIRPSNSLNTSRRSDARKASERVEIVANAKPDEQQMLSDFDQWRSILYQRIREIQLEKT